MLPLWAEWAECTDPEPYIKRVFKNSVRVFEHPFFSLFAPLRTPGSAEKGNTRKRTVCSCREQTIFFLIRDIPISDCRNPAESFVIYMCIAIFRFKGGRAYFFMVGEKFYKQIFLAVTQFF